MRCGHYCTQPAFTHDAGYLIRIKIHVHKRCGAPANHFPAGQFGTGTHESRVYKSSFYGKDIVVEPAGQVQVVHHAAE